jgi:hypothetical protein
MNSEIKKSCIPNNAIKLVNQGSKLIQMPYGT